VELKKRIELTKKVERVLRVIAVILFITALGVQAYNFIANKDQSRKIATVEFVTKKESIFRFVKSSNVEIRIPRGVLVKATIYSDKLKLLINRLVEVELVGRWDLNEKGNEVIITDQSKTKRIEGVKVQVNSSI
jgi:hypothetical protein